LLDPNPIIFCHYSAIGKYLQAGRRKSFAASIDTRRRIFASKSADEFSSFDIPAKIDNRRAKKILINRSTSSRVYFLPHHSSAGELLSPINKFLQAGRRTFIADQ